MIYLFFALWTATAAAAFFARSRRTAMRREGPTDEKEALMATITRGENGLLVDGEPFDPTCCEN